VRTSTTALVLYARVPRQGAVKTRLQEILSAREALSLHVALVEDSIALLRVVSARVGAQPMVAFSEPWDPAADPESPSLGPSCEGIELLPQRGSDLGGRLGQTFRDLTSAGRGSAVIFGSDSPTLPPEWLETACEAVGRGTDVVLGPAEDGGYYLVGARLPAPPIFDGISWGGDRVLGETLGALGRAATRGALLPPWYDVDRPEDLGRARRDIARVAGYEPERTAALLDALVESGRLT
jgi:rSAM/selenodomain-associated transferase 1